MNIDVKRVALLLSETAAIFGLSWVYAWSMGVEPMLAVKLSLGAVAPWLYGKITDADKSVPSLANIKSLVAK